MKKLTEKAHNFLIDKGVKSVKENRNALTIREYLVEFAESINNESETDLNDDEKIHYEALLECCGKILDVIDNGKVPQRQIMGLRILLNR